MAESRKPVISVHDLAKNYGELKVLRKIDMDIYKGEVVSVIGPSGSGKSTFLRCLNYLEELTSGCLLYTSNKSALYYHVRLCTEKCRIPKNKVCHLANFH